MPRLVPTLLALAAGASALSASTVPRTAAPAAASGGGDATLLARAARGEVVERTPAWLMRQAGRYMADFRAYSDKYPFRHRSETPEIATELSLQCWREFGVDGVIMFSDILTPLPALGVEFDVIKGKGPRIEDTLRTDARIAQFAATAKAFDPGAQLPFVGETLRNLKAETEGKTTLVGFVGAPWTLAAYAVEGKATRHALEIKRLMRDEPALAHKLLDATADAVAAYAVHQIDNGAQLVQVFESWAHQMNPVDFEAFSKPYALRVAAAVREAHPDVPVLFFANGGSAYLDRQKDMASDAHYSGLSMDWSCDMARARSVFGDGAVLQGNVDPALLLGDAATVDRAVRDCIAGAGGPGKHILNLGHGVLQPTPEANVQAFVDAAKKYGTV